VFTDSTPQGFYERILAAKPLPGTGRPGPQMTIIKGSPVVGIPALYVLFHTLALRDGLIDRTAVWPTKPSASSDESGV